MTTITQKELYENALNEGIKQAKRIAADNKLTEFYGEDYTNSYISYFAKFYANTFWQSYLEGIEIGKNQAKESEVNKIITNLRKKGFTDDEIKDLLA